jgi:hypothetical protein
MKVSLRAKVTGGLEPEVWLNVENIELVEPHPPESPDPVAKVTTTSGRVLILACTYDDFLLKISRMRGPEL